MVDSIFVVSDDAAFRLAELGRLEPDEEPGDRLGRLTSAAQELLEGALAVSVTVRFGGEDFTFAASNPVAADLDEQQYQRRSGPCTDALDTGEVVTSDDLAQETRWDGWTESAVRAGAIAVHSAPLIAGGERLGALNLYATEEFSRDANNMRMAELLTSHATTLVTNLHRVRDAQVLTEQLREAMHSRAVIEQAKGVLMGQLHVDAETAWQYLVRLSQQSHRKVRDLATTITERASSAVTEITAPLD